MPMTKHLLALEPHPVLLENNQMLVIMGETGCCKSIQIPLYLYETGWP